MPTLNALNDNIYCPRFIKSWLAIIANAQNMIDVYDEKCIDFSIHCDFTEQLVVNIYIVITKYIYKIYIHICFPLFMSLIAQSILGFEIASSFTLHIIPFKD